MWAAVSACRARRISRSRSIPGWVPLASFRRRCASSIRRWSSGGAVGLKRRCCCIARSFPLEEGGSATDVLITDKMPRDRAVISVNAWGSQWLPEGPIVLEIVCSNTPVVALASPASGIRPTAACRISSEISPKRSSRKVGAPWCTGFTVVDPGEA